MGRVVVGVDGSASSEQALRWAAAEAARTGAVLQAVMTWENPSPEVWVPHVSPRGDPLAVTRRALERVVTGVLGEEPGVDVELTAAEGPAARVLVGTANGADLLVVGSRGRGGFAGMMLGSVSFHCVTHAPCPVVVVRGGAAAG